MLDRSLAKDGSAIVLRRWSGLGTARTASDVTVRAKVRDFQPQELVNGLVQGDSHAILSPTPIASAGWGGAVPVPQAGDQVVVDGRARSVLAAVPIKMADVVVRIELQVRG